VAVLILVIAVCLAAVGQILQKSGTMQLGPHPPALTVVRSLVSNFRVFAGFACYAISSLFYLVALSRLPLSFAYPAISLSYVIVTFLAWRVLGEHVSAMRVTGLAIIMAGVVVMALSYYGAPAAASGSAPPTITHLAAPASPGS
jgi:drug/metabolite transporter (DMT)-like permease